MRRSILFSLGALVACTPPSWAPPAPRGTTWEYDHQGFRASGTTVIAGGGPGGSYAGAFHFREANGVKLEESGKDPFAQATPIDGLKFNTHLGQQGTPLGPNGAVVAPLSSAEGPR
ncbi:MAG: hypothetical protein JNL79_07670 [Myxococcales bacterium]|nr:hypothetical protein [Myxococcales bacterium]